MRWKILIPLGLLLLVSFQEVKDPPVASMTIDPLEHPITLHWKDDSGRVMGNIGALKAELERGGHRLLLAMNGGMFMEDQSPLGLYVEQGQEIRPLITKRKGHGNFYLQPNGVFGVDSTGKAFVMNTASYPEQKHVRYATQSGPLLVVDGQINTEFKEGSRNVNFRNGIGVLPDGRVLFAMTREPMNFHDFARFFQQQGCPNALYLDGVISRAYMPPEGLKQMGGALGPLIAVME